MTYCGTILCPTTQIPNEDFEEAGVLKDPTTLFLNGKSSWCSGGTTYWQSGSGRDTQQEARVIKIEELSQSLT
jgi:hypothetical protein